VANLLKKDRLLRDIPVVFLTATVSRREAGPEGLTSGGELFLAKPISVDTLVHCIREHVRPEPDAAPEI